jgi:hypothetical protein
MADSLIDESFLSKNFDMIILPGGGSGAVSHTLVFKNKYNFR